MKKRFTIFISILFALTTSCFAKTPTLFDWTLSKQQIISTFLSDGWKISYNDPFITVEAPSDLNGKLEGYPSLTFKSFMFGFNGDKLVLQSLTFEEADEDFVFADILRIACGDKVKLNSSNSRKVGSDSYDFSYYGILPSCYVSYSAIGNATYMQLIATYSLTSMEN